MNSLVDDRHTVQLTPAQFQLVSDIAKREAGLVLVEAKAAMISSRLVKRLRVIGLKDLTAYCDFVQSSEGKEEIPNMISALTTNVTNFFREMHHFEILRDTVLPDLLRMRGSDDPIRIWSAGCSNGQELYSIAMILAGLCPDALRLGHRILGTDIDYTVINHARKGVYDDTQIAGVPEPLRERYFSKQELKGRTVYTVTPQLRELVKINHLNLIQSWPIRAQFDVIFCRNVAIYFEESTQMTLWGRFAEMLRPGGWLFIGHSERVTNEQELQLASSGLTAYRKHHTSHQQFPLKTGS
ncbi:MAG: protein-glutamate O-methyltransferase [Mangrovicoccus sp.]|nr:protein-glutamate O-methyltransferase [Mangrovicoccus sp.]